MEMLLRRLRSAWVGDQCCAQDLQGRTPLYFAVIVNSIECFTY